MSDWPDVRCDPASGQEIIFATHRRNRPHQSSTSPDGDAAETCPFCPGNEAMLTDIVWQLGENGAWLSRSVPNLYPLVTPPAGRHEVIIDSPDHAMSPRDMTLEDWQAVVAAWGARFEALSQRWRYVALFRNVGTGAGASIRHPHSQIVALAGTPGRVLARHRRLRRIQRLTGQCMLCATLQTGGHLVIRNDVYAAIVPDAAEVPFEVWIAPRRHASAPVPVDEGDRQPLAEILHETVARLGAVLGDFDHNMMLMDASRDGRPYLHWFLRIRPVMEPTGGFERLTGMAVNSSWPEDDAARLRSAVPLRITSVAE